MCVASQPAIPLACCFLLPVCRCLTLHTSWRASRPCLLPPHATPQLAHSPPLGWDAGVAAQPGPGAVDLAGRSRGRRGDRAARRGRRHGACECLAQPLLCECLPAQVVKQSSAVNDTQDTKRGTVSTCCGNASPTAGRTVTTVVLALDSRLMMQDACALLLGPQRQTPHSPFPPPTNSPQQEQTAPPCFDGVLCSERLGRLGLVPSHLGEEQLLVKLVTLDLECCRLGLCGSGASGCGRQQGQRVVPSVETGCASERAAHTRSTGTTRACAPSGPSVSRELPNPCVMHAGPQRSQQNRPGP